MNEVMAGQYGVQGSIDYFHPLLLFLPWTPIGTSPAPSLFRPAVHEPMSLISTTSSVDGKELTDQPWKLFTAGNFTKGVRTRNTAHASATKVLTRVTQFRS